MLTDLFVHAPLDLTRQQIRLVKLNYEVGNEAIELEVRHFEVGSDSECPEYCALSYMWGPENPSSIIKIGGKQFIIRENLHLFLEEAYRQHFEHWIWIDQLSIAQENSKERNHQVSMMAQVYGQATKVIAWLGRAQPGQMSSHQLFNLLYQNDDGVVRSPTFKRNRDAGKNPTIQAQAKLICSNPYWRRLWIVQEIRLARRLEIWQESDLHIETVLELMLYFVIGPWLHASSRVDPDTTRAQWLLKNMHTLPENRRQSQLKEVVAAVHDSCCEDVRDIIYGIQSLVEPDSQVIIDYEQDVGNVFHEALIVMTWESKRERNENSETFLKTALDLRQAMFPCKSLSQELINTTMRRFLIGMLWTWPPARTLRETRDAYHKQILQVLRAESESGDVKQVLQSLGFDVFCERVREAGASERLLP
jgi:hypothetical protein